MSTLSAPVHSRASARAARSGRSLTGLLRNLLVSVAAIVVLMFMALLPMLTPAWIHTAMLASGAAAEGASVHESLALSDVTVHELIFGPGTFAITYAGGQPLYGADEIGHMQDVRTVLMLFALVAAVAMVVLVLGFVADRRDAWRSVARGGAALALGLIVAGVAAALAFGLAFELFHRILFPGGNWAFDPAQSNLVRLYPMEFWQLSAAAYGILGLSLGVAAWLIGRRGAQAPEPAPAESPAGPNAGPA
jgi:hypothetical protein